MTTICRTLRVGRATVYRAGSTQVHRYAKREDRVLLVQFRDVLC